MLDTITCPGCTDRCGQCGPDDPPETIISRTRFGTVRMRPDGWYRLEVSYPQALAWATRPHSTWPCSTLVHVAAGAVDALTFAFSDLGDLVDRNTDAEIDGRELTCWATDVLLVAGFSVQASDQAARL